MRTTMKTALFLPAASLLAALVPAAWGADWTQFRGPNHDGSSSERIPDRVARPAAPK